MRRCVGDDHRVAIVGKVVDRLADQAAHGICVGTGRQFVGRQIGVGLRRDRGTATDRVKQLARQRAALFGIGDRGRVERPLLGGAGQDLTVQAAEAKLFGGEPANLLAVCSELARDADHVAWHAATIAGE